MRYSTYRIGIGDKVSLAQAYPIILLISLFYGRNKPRVLRLRIG
jgi:hypothetical protein